MMDTTDAMRALENISSPFGRVLREMVSAPDVDVSIYAAYNALLRGAPESEVMRGLLTALVTDKRTLQDMTTELLRHAPLPSYVIHGPQTGRE